MPGPLRVFKAGSAKLPGAELLCAPKEPFKLDPDSGDGRALLAENTPQELRSKYGTWVNDIRNERVAILYWEAADNKGKVSLRPVPAKLLRKFFNDISFDWASFAEGSRPPNEATDTQPLFDPRFVQFARKTGTAGDAASAASVAAAVAVAPTPEAKTMAATTSKEPVIKPKPKPKAKPKAKTKTAAAPKDPVAKPKAKPKPKPKPKAKAKPKTAGPKKPTPPKINTDLVLATHGETYTDSQEFRNLAAWFGGTTARPPVGIGAARASIAAEAAMIHVANPEPTGVTVVTSICGRVITPGNAAALCGMWEETVQEEHDTVLTD